MTLHVPNLTTDVQTGPQANFATCGVAASGPYRTFFKRTLDLALVLLSLPVVLPLILLLAVLVAVLTGGSPFYAQQRIGLNGRYFRMWKLRTMVPDAAERLEQYLDGNSAARTEWDSTQKLKHDPRITAFGRLLRKTSLDELPQLINVLNGSMSLVGPRPMMIDQKGYYHGTAYFRLRPGITGLWQISDRNDCSFNKRVEYDDAYASQLSFKTDLSILIRTVGVVLRATGY